MRAKKGYISATINYRYLSEEVSVFDMLDDIDTAIDGIKSQLAKLGTVLLRVKLSVQLHRLNKE